jgi:hypothetical protein
MWGWQERWHQRQRDLAHGADADLFRDNRKRYRRSYALTGCGIVLGLVGAKIKLPGALHIIVVTLAIVLLLAGGFLNYWAESEYDFLQEPDPEKPPTIFRK